jgi:sortase (surface protein transpeptidase)
MKVSSHKLIQIAATGLTVAGLAVLAPFVYFWVTNHQVAAQQSVVVQRVDRKPAAITGRPVRIAVPSLKIDLAVIDGNFDKKSGEWTLTLDKAQYATPSVQPNDQGGNTLIYGHYRPEVFAYLHHIVAGAQAVITTDNGYTFTYTYKSSEALNPRDTSVFTYQGPPRLTIQTCSGSYMQNRQMYYFDYVGYTKN